MAAIFSSSVLSSGKRVRQEDEDEIEKLRLDRKKPRTLPFRTSPTTKHTSLFSQHREQISKPPVLTPTDSSEDESDEPSPMRYGPSPSYHILPYLPTDKDTDLAMDDTEFPPWSLDEHSAQPNYWQPATQNPVGMPPHAALPQVPRLSENSTRIPTPIYGHFNIVSNDTLMTTPTSYSIPEPSKSRFDHDTQHDLFHRRRRLPSPISEDEDMASPTSTTHTLLRKLDMSATPSTAHFPSDGDTNMMTPLSPAPDASLESGWRNTRRGAVDVDRGLSALKIKEGGKRKVLFSMGFKADCEKCRQRIPGHWNHVTWV